jgi:formylglycine-generating enzyme required for sulfatase activity
MGRRSTERGFTGQLNNFALLDIIQMGCLAQRDGRLSIRQGRRRAEIILLRGRIIHAATKAQVGEEALLEILSWEKGEFQFGPAKSAGDFDPTIRGGWEQVLMDAVRKRDELRFSGSVGSPDSPGSMDQLAAAELLDRVEKERARNKKMRLLRRLYLTALVLIAIVVTIYFSSTNRELLIEDARNLQSRLASLVAGHGQWQRTVPEQVRIPGGEFIYQDGERQVLQSFVIDVTEVTIWDYTEFLRAIGSDTRFDHPLQDPHKGHSNPDWERYSQAALAGQVYQGVRLNPNFPAVYLDWFDAYAFAKWKGRRLPTEQEWEKAARGTDGRRYPWGSEPLIDGANLFGAVPTGSSWTPVGTWHHDQSPYGVRDMAGNVSEWTATADSAGDPVIRGGNFRSETGELTRRILGFSPRTKDERIGFRTVSDAGPDKDRRRVPEE